MDIWALNNLIIFILDDHGGMFENDVISCCSVQKPCSLSMNFFCQKAFVLEPNQSILLYYKQARLPESRQDFKLLLRSWQSCLSSVQIKKVSPTIN